MNWSKNDGYGIPVLLAIGIHAGIILTGIIAVDFSDNETQKPKVPVIVNATIIDISDTVIGKRESQEKEIKRQNVVAAEKRKKEAAQKKKREIEKKTLEAKQKKDAQAKAKAKNAAKKEREKKQAEEKKRLAQETDKKRLAKAAEKKRLDKKVADAKKAKEQELIRQIEEDRLASEQRKREEEAKKLAEQKRQAEAAQALAAAETERERAADEAQMVQSISSLINARVTSVWSRPANARNGMKATLRIDFLPNGEISNVQVTKSSGDALFDQRTLDAVNKVAKIEELADVDSYTFERNFRKVDLIFNPQDLRN